MTAKLGRKILKFKQTFIGLLTAIIASSAYAAPAIQHWQTVSGTPVYFVENHDLPLLDISVDFAAGSSMDTPAKSGLANLTMHLLDLGAAGLSDNEISKRLADVGAQLGGHFDSDRAGVTLRTLSSAAEREQALDILSKVLQQPDFPESVLQREKARVIAGLQEAETQPASIAQKAFSAALYGTHPYALEEAGEVASVSALQRADLTTFYRTYFSADRAVVALIGDITKAQAAAIAERLTGNLPKAIEKISALPAVQLPTAPVTRNITHPASQSHILLGYPGISRSDPDYFPLTVGNYIFGGGGFDSRLINEVRQKRGLAYSAYSYFIPLKQQGPFEIGLQTKKDQAQQALSVVQQTLRAFIADGPTSQELTQAKNNLVGGFPLRLDSNKKILEYLAAIGFYKLPLTYLDDYVKNVEQVTVPQIRSAFARHIQPEHMVTVVVGSAPADTPLPATQTGK